MFDPEEPNNELKETAAVLARLQDVEPDDKMRRELKEAYLARAANDQRRPRFLAARRVAALAAAILLSSGGAVYAANDAMPDDTLYPVKRMAEAAALSVTFGETRTHLENVLARKRLREAGHLLNKKAKAAERSTAIELLEEAREEGDRGLKKKVDELLEQVGQGNGRENRLKETPGENKANEAPGRLKEKPEKARGR